MKIVSPFRDFYDRALAYGYDEHTVYVRKPVELYNGAYGNSLRDIRDYDFLFVDGTIQDLPGHNHSTISFAFVRVLFCGKLYNGVRVTVKPHWSLPAETKTAVYYDADALVNAVHQAGGDIDADFRRSDRRWWGHRFFYDNSLRSWLSNQGSPIHQDYAIQNKFITLVVDHDQPTRVIKDAKLADYDFYRTINPVIAYQEIEMFVSGVLASAGNQMVVTEDKYKILAAGFDQRSFRKSPTKHR